MTYIFRTFSFKLLYESNYVLLYGALRMLVIIIIFMCVRGWVHQRRYSPSCTHTTTDNVTLTHSMI